METTQTREDILSSSLVAREQEVLHYQINIDNYTIALSQINKMPMEDQAELSGFCEQLRTLLASEKLEQKKAKVMLSVIKHQLGVE